STFPFAAHHTPAEPSTSTPHADFPELPLPAPLPAAVVNDQPIQPTVATEQPTDAQPHPHTATAPPLRPQRQRRQPSHLSDYIVNSVQTPAPLCSLPSQSSSSVPHANWRAAMDTELRAL
ncbi:unnamed protein product, partial [Cuscuta campestris]